MADNVLVDNGNETDYTVASEELTGGVHLQSVELHTESAGTKTKAGTSGNPLRTDPTGSTTQPVSVASLPLPSGAATAANQSTIIGHIDTLETLLAAIQAAVEVLDNTVAGSEIQADVLTVPADPFGANADAAVAAGAAGSIQAKLRRLTSDTDAIKTAVETLDNAIAGSEMQVDVLTLPALAAGTANIGDVDVASVPAPLSTTGGGTEAAALRVTVASDSTGVLSVDDNGSSLTVDGTVTANAGTGTMAVKEANGATSALTTVADNAASTSILASNANRLQATITNDSSARLYLRFEAAVASTSNYGVSLAQHETWVEDVYTGEIRGIWASDPNDGAARVTEITA